MDKWECKACNNLDRCVLLMPSDHNLTATVCPYSGTDQNWQKVEDTDNICPLSGTVCNWQKDEDKDDA
jgi:hypothetical protein